MWATPKIFAGLTWLLLCATDVSGQDVGPAIPEQVPFESALLLPPLPFSDQVPVHSILSEQFLAPPSSHLADGVSKHGDFDWSNVPVYTKVPWAGWFTTVVGGPG